MREEHIEREGKEPNRVGISRGVSSKFDVRSGEFEEKRGGERGGGATGSRLVCVVDGCDVDKG